MITNVKQAVLSWLFAFVMMIGLIRSFAEICIERDSGTGFMI